LLIALAGCYTTVEIRADQIPKLSFARTEAVGPSVTTIDPSGPGLVTYQGYSRSHVEMLAPDGSTVVVKGDADLDLDTRDGRHYHFQHPIDAHLEGDTLVIEADDRTGRIAIDQIARARVRSLNYGKSIGLATAISVGVGVLTLALVL
jgi:hypothetical protein